MVEVVKEERRKAMEAESELKEQSVMQRLKYSEAMQHIADLKQTIAQLELKVTSELPLIDIVIVSVFLIKFATFNASESVAAFVQSSLFKFFN